MPGETLRPQNKGVLRSPGRNFSSYLHRQVGTVKESIDSVKLLKALRVDNSTVNIVVEDEEIDRPSLKKCLHIITEISAGLPKYR